MIQAGKGADQTDYLTNFMVPMTDRDREGLRKVLHVMPRMSFYPSLVTENGQTRKIIAGMVGKDQRLEIYEDEGQVYVTLPPSQPDQLLDFTQVPHNEPGRA